MDSLATTKYCLICYKFGCKRINENLNRNIGLANYLVATLVTTVFFPNHNNKLIFNFQTTREFGINR